MDIQGYYNTEGTVGPSHTISTFDWGEECETGSSREGRECNATVTGGKTVTRLLQGFKLFSELSCVFLSALFGRGFIPGIWRDVLDRGEGISGDNEESGDKEREESLSELERIGDFLVAVVWAN